MTTLIAALLIAVAALVPGTHVVDEHYEDGSSLTAIEWPSGAPDEPNYLGFITDAETGAVRVVAGP